MPPILLRLDTRNLTWRECWWQTRGPVFLILAFCKLLRIRLPNDLVLPYISQLTDFEVPAESVPTEIFAQLERPIAQLAAHGFQPPAFYRYANSRGNVVTHFAGLLHSSGNAMARVMHSRAGNLHPPKETLRVVFLAQLQDGTWLVGAANRAELEGPPAVKVLRQINAPPIELWRAFSSELDRQRPQNPPQLIPDRAAAEELSNRYERLGQDYNITRGLYVPLNEAEITEEQATAASQQQVAGGVGDDDAAVLTEVERQLVEKPKWTNGLWILGLSLLAFIGAGVVKWDWEIVLLLVPILFVHEAGHWLAMKLFGYRNLRMFFIPLFGAAVTGRHFNVAGWKKALVSLAGPAPGIVLAAGMAVAALWLEQPWLEKAALFTIILNAFNLLPFVPLDGGWYLNAVLFCRNAWLETGFKLFATLGLLTASVVTDDRIWLFLGILMAISLPATWRIGRIADCLHALKLPTQSLDQQTIPPSVAVEIIAAVRNSTKQPRNLKTLATETLSVFEHMNARPPGVLGTLVLLVAYAGVLGVGFLGLGAVGVVQGGGLAFLNDRTDGPPPPLVLRARSDCGDTEAIPLQPPDLELTNRLILTGLFPDSEAAKAAWLRVTNAPVAQATRVGSALIAVFPGSEAAASQPVAELLSSLGTNHLRWEPLKDIYLWINLSCEPPIGKAVTNLLHELDAYFALPGQLAAPPWLPGFTPTEEQRRVRHTWRRLSETALAIEDNPELKKAWRKMARSFGSGDTNRMNAAATELASIRKRLDETSETELLASGDPLIDLETVAAWRTQREADGEEQNWLGHSETISRRAGALTKAPSATDAQAFTASGGAGLEEGRLVFRGLSFLRLESAFPVFVNWLCARGCSDIRFDLHSAGDEEELE